MNTDIRLIVCDMDGTLLDPQKRITAATADAVRVAREQGIAVTVCSGRIHTMMGAYLKTLPIQGLYLAANGAIVADATNDKLVWGAPIAHADAQALTDYAAAEGLDVGALGPTACYFLKQDICMERFLAYNRLVEPQGVTGVVCRVLAPYKPLPEAVYKLLICEQNDQKRERMARFISDRPGLSCTSSEPALLDVSAAGVDKGTGLLRLMELMGLKKEQVCTFGDYLNDLPMLREAGLGIAMGNACEELKRQADFVTGTNAEDGVAQAIRARILSQKGEQL